MQAGYRIVTMSICQPFGPWVAYSRPAIGARIQLFCFPYAGGGASIFRSWGDELSSDVALLPVQYPGREGRLQEERFETLDAMVEAIAAGLLPGMDRPFAFFGHSMGALVAFYLARLLRDRHGRQPTHLVVSACQAPQLPRDRGPISHLPVPRFLEEVGRYGGLPDILLREPDLLAMFLPILRSDFKILESDRPAAGARLECPITAIGGQADPFVSETDLAAWQDQTSGRFTLHMLPGGHFFLNESRAVAIQVLADAIASTSADPQGEVA